MVDDAPMTRADVKERRHRVYDATRRRCSDCTDDLLLMTTTMTMTC